jgi:hypothetical protein
MAIRFRQAPSLEQQLPEMTAPAMAQKGREIAAAATATGRNVSPSYSADVQEGPEGVSVVATGSPLVPAGWIEFGTANLPPAAPLRSAAQVAGMDVRYEG